MSLAEMALLIFKLGRPKFLVYSFTLHLLGVLLARQQSATTQIDWQMFAWFQFTITVTHMMTHYINDYADYAVDKLNRNAGAWTGGSKVLKDGLLSRNTALLVGVAFAAASLLGGYCTVHRYLTHRRGVDVSFASWHDVETIVVNIPWDFVALGVSVLIVAVAYSVPPLHLSANALGELCVSYVLTFATPLGGTLMQGGTLTYDFCCALAPLFVMNAARMVVMNIPDRDGDKKGGKITSVVLLGEARAVTLTNVVYLAIYCSMLPQLPLSRAVRVAYYAVAPLRWWQSLRLNAPKWWLRRRDCDSLPFVESMYILANAAAVCAALQYDYMHRNA
jgi:1,4-dihydroxy-2-naphthoate octaprenyltransferase